MSNLSITSNLYQNAQIQKLAESKPAKPDTKDAFVDATQGTVNLADLKGAVENAQSDTPTLAGIPVKNSIFIGIQNNGKVEVHRIDLKNPANLQTIKDWTASLKAGKSNMPFPFSRLKTDQSTIDSDLGAPRLKDDNLTSLLSSAYKDVVGQINSQWHSFGLNQTRDGAQLSNEQKLYLAANILQNNGLLESDQKQAKHILGKLFFENNSKATDVIQNISFTDQGGLKIQFASAFEGDVTRRKDLDIAPPNWYTGTDNNSRRAGISMIQNKLPGTASAAGRYVPSAVPSSYMSQVGQNVERAFLADPNSQRFRSMTPSARRSDVAYQTGLNSYKFVHQQNYKKHATELVLSDLQDYASKNGINLKRATPDQLQELTRQAVRSLLSNVENPSTGVTFITSARTPAQFSLEDEAAVEDAMRQLTGATVNLDATPAILASFITGSGTVSIQPAR